MDQVKNTVNIQVTRVSGANRYATAAEVGSSTPNGNLDGLQTVTEIWSMAKTSLTLCLLLHSWVMAVLTLRAMVLG